MRLLLAYARHRGSFILRIEDAEGTGGGEWDEVLRNPRINRGSSFYIFVFSFFVLSLFFRLIWVVVRQGVITRMA